MNDESLITYILKNDGWQCGLEQGRLVWFKNTETLKRQDEKKNVVTQAIAWLRQRIGGGFLPASCVTASNAHAQILQDILLMRSKGEERLGEPRECRYCSYHI